MIGNLGGLDVSERYERDKYDKVDDLTSFALRQFIEHLVSGVFCVTIIELKSGSRGRANVALARQVGMYLGHVTFGISMHDVGVMFDRDRTTVSHACAVIEDRRDQAQFDLTMEFLDCASMLALSQGDAGHQITK